MLERREKFAHEPARGESGQFTSKFTTLTSVSISVPGGVDAAVDLPNVFRRDSNNFTVVGKKTELSKDVREICFSPIPSLYGCFTNLIFYAMLNNSISEIILQLGLDPTKKSSAWIQENILCRFPIPSSQDIFNQQGWVG